MVQGAPSMLHGRWMVASSRSCASCAGLSELGWAPKRIAQPSTSCRSLRFHHAEDQRTSAGPASAAATRASGPATSSGSTRASHSTPVGWNMRLRRRALSAPVSGESARPARSPADICAIDHEGSHGTGPCRRETPGAALLHSRTGSALAERAPGSARQARGLDCGFPWSTCRVGRPASRRGLLPGRRAKRRSRQCARLAHFRASA